jgi:hypothetical protein
MDDDSARDDGAAFEATKPLGGRTVVVLRRLLAVGVLVDLVVTGFVLTEVPLDTTISYTRVSNEWQIPMFALFAAPALLLTLWWQTRKAEGQPLPPGNASSSSRSSCRSWPSSWAPSSSWLGTTSSPGTLSYRELSRTSMNWSSRPRGGFRWARASTGER